MPSFFGRPKVLNRLLSVRSVALGPCVAVAASQQHVRIRGVLARVLRHVLCFVGRVPIRHGERNSWYRHDGPCTSIRCANVCVFPVKLIFPPIYIQHHQCRCRCLSSRNDLCGQTLRNRESHYKYSKVIWPSNSERDVYGGGEHASQQAHQTTCKHEEKEERRKYRTVLGWDPFSFEMAVSLMAVAHAMWYNKRVASENLQMVLLVIDGQVSMVFLSVHLSTVCVACSGMVPRHMSFF